MLEIADENFKGVLKIILKDVNENINRSYKKELY